MEGIEKMEGIESGILALNQNWLDNSGSLAQASNCSQTLTIGSTGLLQGNTTWFYPSGSYGWSYPVYISSPARPIKLTMSEVQRLQKAAKESEALKKVLAKFTSLIEVTVDFGE